LRTYARRRRQLRIYRASASALFVLDENDDRVAVELAS
jgi:hypothetical protein